MNTPTQKQTPRVPGESRAADPSVVAAAAAGTIAAAQVAHADAAVDTSRPTKITAHLEGTVEQQLAAERAKNAELAAHVAELLSASQAMLKQLNVKAAPVEPAVKLPTMAEAKADVEARVARGEPVHAVLTKEGHYVHPLAGYQQPAGMAIDPKTMAAMVAAITVGQQAAAAASAAKPAKIDHGLEPGKAPKDED